MNFVSFTQINRPPELSSVLQLNEQVDEIERNLPQHLQIGSDLSAYGSRSQALQLQAAVVRAR